MTRKKKKSIGERFYKRLKKMEKSALRSKKRISVKKLKRLVGGYDKRRLKIITPKEKLGFFHFED